MIRQIPTSKGRSLRGRQVAEYLRGRTDDAGDHGGELVPTEAAEELRRWLEGGEPILVRGAFNDDAITRSLRQTHLHRSSGGNDPSNGAGGSDSGDELLETGAEG